MIWEEDFCNLVSNHFMPNYDYSRSIYPFKTVFYISPHYFCCCDCAYDHEYIDYVSEDGTIDGTKYRKILQSIRVGECPHVDQVDDKYTRETSIHGIHVAAAVGTEQAMMYYMNDFEDTSRRVFDLSPFQLAVLKGRTSIVAHLCTAIPDMKPHMVHMFEMEFNHAYRTQANSKVLVVEKTSIPEFCVRHKDRGMLKAILCPFVQYKGIHKALEYVFKHNFKDFEKDLMTYIQSVHNFFLLQHCSVSAIVYERPDVFGDLLNIQNDLKFFDESSYFSSGVSNLVDVCMVLEREACLSVIMPYTYISSNTEVISPLESLDLMHEHFGDYNVEIVTKLRSTPQIQESINILSETGVSRLHTCVGGYPDEVKLILEMGADVDILDSDGRTPLIYLLSKYHDASNFNKLRATIELILFENPSIELNKAVIKLAIAQDASLEKMKSYPRALPGEYKMDGKLRLRMSCDEITSPFLNFLGPLFIECGFPVCRRTLPGAFNEVLDVEEYNFIHNVLNTPRSLILQSRDALRNHFKGRKIHSYIQSLEMPKKLKEFILLITYFKSRIQHL